MWGGEVVYSEWDGVKKKGKENKRDKEACVEKWALVKGETKGEKGASQKESALSRLTALFGRRCRCGILVHGREGWLGLDDPQKIAVGAGLL